MTILLFQIALFLLSILIELVIQIKNKQAIN